MPSKVLGYGVAAMAGAAATAAVAWYSNRLALYPSRYLYNALEGMTDHLRKEQQLARKTCFTIDRILDADCKGKPLTIGVHTNPLAFGPYGNQGIRHGGVESPIRRLLEFRREGPAQLDYTFEGETHLMVNKQPDGTLRYSFRDPVTDVAKTIDPLILKGFKGIDMNSQELDAIAQLR